MTYRKTKNLAVLTALLSASAAWGAAATDRTWQDNAGANQTQWPNTANWVGSNPADTSTEQAVFSSSATAKTTYIDFSGGQFTTIASVRFNSSGWTINQQNATLSSLTLVGYNPGTDNTIIFNAATSGSNTIGAKIVLGVNNAIINVAGGGTQNIGGVIDDGVNAYTLIKNGDGTLGLTAVNTYNGGTNVNAGIVNVSGNQSASDGGWAIDPNNGGTTVTSTVNFNAGSTIAVASGKSIILGGTSGHFGARTLNSSGTVNNDGTLTVRRSSTVNVNAGTWTQNGAATVATQGGGLATLNINTGGSLVYGSATNFRIDTSTSININSVVNVNGGTLTTGVKFHNGTSTPTSGNAAQVILTNGGTLKLSASVADLATTAGANFDFLVGQTGTGGIVNTNGFDTTLNRSIINLTGETGKLTKTGAGTLTLAAANSYTGDTTVSAGTLLVNGSTTTSTFNVNNTATLGGTGTIGGTVNIGANATLAPGASIESLDVNAATINGKLAIQINDADANIIDLLNVTNNLNITSATVDFDVTGGLTQSAYIFATYGSLTGTQFANVIDLPTGYVIKYAFNGNNIALVSVPTPAALPAGLAVIGFLTMRRRL
ncbi:MAG: hypothetical protein GC162_17180 [Planctomycetes bacterium]|nr:hypothetical protein [Planctomycetota bacterium]